MSLGTDPFGLIHQGIVDVLAAAEGIANEADVLAASYPTDAWAMMTGDKPIVVVCPAGFERTPEDPGAEIANFEGQPHRLRFVIAVVAQDIIGPAGALGSKVYRLAWAVLKTRNVDVSGGAAEGPCYLYSSQGLSPVVPAPERATGGGGSVALWINCQTTDLAL